MMAVRRMAVSHCVVAMIEKPGIRRDQNSTGFAGNSATKGGDYGELLRKS